MYSHTERSPFSIALQKEEHDSEEDGEGIRMELQSCGGCAASRGLMKLADLYNSVRAIMALSAGPNG